MGFFKNRKYLALEFLLLCVVLPTIIIVFRLGPHMFFFLWAAWAICWQIYRHYHKAELLTLWRWHAVTWKALKPILIRWAICSVLILLFTMWYDPSKLFYLVKEKPLVIPFLMVFYPIFSALPQEFIFCTFFFDRYKPFFPTNTIRIWASAVTFAYAHVLFINPVAPALSFIGGLIFATTYARSRSLALVTIEHSLYGIVLFVVGLGWYFWSGGLV